MTVSFIVEHGIIEYILSTLPLQILFWTQESKQCVFPERRGFVGCAGWFSVNLTQAKATWEWENLN